MMAPEEEPFWREAFDIGYNLGKKHGADQVRRKLIERLTE